tara:strand:- start:348 stop:530 length:183 start_codon:yes stop_codon:yes gene_type:complete
MKKLKTLLPFIAALGVFFLASNSEMNKQMNQHHSMDKEIKAIPIDDLTRINKLAYQSKNL